MVWWFPATGGLKKGAFPLEPIEYVFMEATSSPHDVMYDDLEGVGPISTAQTISSTTTSKNSQRKLVRTSDGTLYVTYQKSVAGNYRIYVKKSVDDGVTWTDETHISTYPGMNSYEQQYSAIAVDSKDYLHVVWWGRAAGYTGATQIQAWYALYDGSWNTPIRISTYAGMNLYRQYNPKIAVDSEDNLHVVWYGAATGYLSRPIWYAKGVSPYAAGDWTVPIIISTYPGQTIRAQGKPSIAVDSNDYIHVVWVGLATGYTTKVQTWHTVYTDSWPTPVRISTYAGMDANNQGESCIAVDSDDNLHAVWHGLATGYTTINQIWYAKGVSPYGAGDWATPVRVSTYNDMDLYQQLFPSIAVDSANNISVLWSAKAEGYTTYDVVWHALYTNSWATPVVLQPAGRNQYPNLRWSRWPR